MDPDPSSLSYISFSLSGFFASYGAYLGAIFVLLLFSGLISGSEVAYFSLSQVERENFKSGEDRISRIAWDLIRHPKKLLATILIFNNLVNVAIILLSTLVLNGAADLYGWGLSPVGKLLMSITEIGIITFILLFFGEITPKIYAAQRRVTIVRAVAVPMNVLRILATPLSWVLINSTRFIDKRVRVENEGASFADIKQAIDLTSEEESPDEEKEILKGIVNFSSISVKSIMRARVDVCAINAELSFEEVVQMVNEFGYSRLPVFSETLDKVQGILYVKDLLPLLREGADTAAWKELMRPAYFIPESKKIDDLLDEFKKRRLHIAIVVDEFGGTAGLVTLEDIIEEIFGEIVDEFDTDDELPFSKLSDTTYVFDGKMPLHDIIKILELPDHIFDEGKGEADSLAGLILELEGRIPEKGTTLQYDQFEFTVESVSKNRIKRVKMTVVEAEPENSPAS